MKVRKAVIPVAGFATRFLPACKSIPKCMLNIVDKPILQYLIDEASESGIEELVLIVGRKQEVIREYLSEDAELKKFLIKRGKENFIPDIANVSRGMKIHFVEENEAKGLGYAIYMAKDIIGEEPFAVMYGDVIFHGEEPCLLEIIKKYEELETAVIGLEQVSWDEVHKYGNLDGELISDGLFKVTSFVEKPEREEAKTNYAISDRHVLTPDIFDVLEKVKPSVGGEIQLTDGFNGIAKSGEGIHAYACKSKRFDAGDKLGLAKVTIAECLRRENIKGEMIEYIKGIKF
ncbi:MAG: UTP--glucose-1-phosphate uridylyltransferase [Oscillospiraceae bacterium]|nr:UTP--glucose-1-phosphate uridylyltransferase [Oscillospiraceae bacterium]